MASRKIIGASESASKTPLQRLLSERGIPMSSTSHDTQALALFTPEERRELRRGASEQCEANR